MMKSVCHLITLLCFASLAAAACSADDVTCEDPITFKPEGSEFYITKFTPSQSQKGVLLDATIRLQFSDAVSSTKGFEHFFFLLNQAKGTAEDFPATCVRVINSYTLELPVVSCFGDVLEPETAYVFYISQRLQDDTVVTLSSIKDMPISEKAFGLQFKSIVFYTTSEIVAEVVPEHCSPSFNAVDVPRKTAVTIAFNAQVHLGTGTIELRSVTNHPVSSVSVDVTDAKHVALGSDGKSIIVFGLELSGNQQYQVRFDSSVALSASGSKCRPVDTFLFTTEPDREKPYILLIHPKDYKTNLPVNTVIRIVFSEIVVPGVGTISFTSEKGDIEVNVQNPNEVTCMKDECRIKPSEEFQSATYTMSFGESAFADLAGNTLLKGVSSHVFTVSGATCGMEYVNVEKDQPCFCQSLENQCQCKCGDTYFVKDY